MPKHIKILGKNDVWYLWEENVVYVWRNKNRARTVYKLGYALDWTIPPENKKKKLPPFVDEIEQKLLVCSSAWSVMSSDKSVEAFTYSVYNLVRFKNMQEQASELIKYLLNPKRKNRLLSTMAHRALLYRHTPVPLYRTDMPHKERVFMALQLKLKNYDNWARWYRESVKRLESLRS